MSGSILQRIVRVGLLALLALLQANPALAGPPQRFVVFGDSLSDPGNAFVLTGDIAVPPFSLIPNAPYARGGLHFSDGATWVEQLSVFDDAIPSAGPALLHPVLFSNYAVGGARARTRTPPEEFFDLSRQVGQFADDFGPQAPADALYIVFVGGNDVRDALLALDPLDPTFATSFGIIDAAVDAIGANLLALHAAGAQSFLVANAPNLGLAPAVHLLGPVATFLAAQFNTELEAKLQEPEFTGLNIVPLNVFGILSEVVAAPEAFGLTNVTQPCIAVDTKTHPFCSNPSAFLFWDGIHPTVAGHRILAERARAALNVTP